MSLLGALTGSDAAKAAKRAAGLQADAANQAGGLLNTAYLDGGKLQANAATQGAGILGQGYQAGMDYSRAGYGDANNTLNSGLTAASGYLQPYANLGTQAGGLLGQGLADGSLTRSFGAADFQADPGYAFRKQQGMDGIQGSAAAGGGLMSGATLKALTGYNSDLASQEYGNAYNRFSNDQSNAFNRLSGTTQMGLGASNALSGLAYNNAANVANNQTGLAGLLANGALGQANANANGVTGAAGYQAQGMLGGAEARANGLLGAANANSTGLLAAQQARSQGLGNMLGLVSQVGAAMATGGMSAGAGGGLSALLGAGKTQGVQPGSLNIPYSNFAV